jgi:hypothetical protein
MRHATTEQAQVAVAEKVLAMPRMDSVTAAQTRSWHAARSHERNDPADGEEAIRLNPAFAKAPPR